MSVHLPLIAHDTLRGLYSHRLLSTTQVHRLYAPTSSMRWARASLADLEQQGLVARVRIAGGRGFAWYLLREGVKVTEGAGIEVRGYRIDARRAAGPLQAHTLATNEVGLAFVEAARRYGDDCWSEAWRNETAHRIGAGGTGEVVISDAVLDYTIFEEGRGSTLLTRFIEIDRATTPVRTLVRKLESYARLYGYRPAWRAYPRFPAVLIVMAGPPEVVLHRRIDALASMLPLSAPLANAPEVTISAVTLEQLRRHGPHAPIFWRQGDDTLVDIRGRPSARAMTRACSPRPVDVDGLSTKEGR